MSHVVPSHGTKTGAARGLVVFSAAIAFFAHGSQAQQIARPVASIGGSAPLAKISCHGITNVAMTADAEQILPLRLVANLPCGQEVSVLSDFDGYTVAVRTPEGMSGYVARIYLAASSKAVKRSTTTPTSAEVKAGVASWQAGAPGCDQYHSGDGAIELMTVDGVTVQVSLQDTGWKFRTNVAIANKSSSSVHLVPSHVLLDMIRPALHPLAYEDPDRLASATTHQIYMTTATAEPATHSVTHKASASGDGRNYFAAAVDQGNFNGSPYAVNVQEYSADALREASIAPGSSLAGAVWFERSKHAEELLLRVPVNGVLFEFPLSFQRQK